MENTNLGSKLEQATFRLYYSDGIMDLAFGSMLIIFAINSILDLKHIETSFMMRILIVPVVIIFALFKALYTQKRLGHVKYKPSRNRKRLIAMLIASSALILTSILFYFSSKGLIATGQKNGFITLILEFVILIAIFSLLAYFTDYYNFYLVGLAMGIGSPLALLTEPISGTTLYGLLLMLMAGMALFIFGTVQLIIFMIQHPRNASHEN